MKTWSAIREEGEVSKNHGVRVQILAKVRLWCCPSPRLNRPRGSDLSSEARFTIWGDERGSRESVGGVVDRCGTAGDSEAIGGSGERHHGLRQRLVAY